MSTVTVTHCDVCDRTVTGARPAGWVTVPLTPEVVAAIRRMTASLLLIGWSLAWAAGTA